MSNIREIIKTKLQYLNDNGVDASSFEIKLLLAEALDTDVSGLTFYNSEISASQLQKFEEYIEKRKNFCPVDKILGKKNFYKLEFEVNNDVLSPRYDTEILIDETLKLFNPTDEIKILEFGTGSGCIVISLLDELKNATAFGVDISEKALKITKTNAIKNNVAGRLTLINASWFDEDIINRINQKFDIIISNPPYIPSKDIETLDNEVKNFDPLVALDGGEDGLRDYRKICELSEKMLKNNGYLVFEAGINQADDYNCINRCVIFKKTD